MTASERRPVSIDAYEARAEQVLPKMVFDYIAAGAGEEWTVRENRAAWGEYVLRPRVLVDVGDRDLSTTVLGRAVSMPILIAPTALHRLAHPDGELATARAAATAETIMCLSSIASATIEDVAAATAGPKWFQLYVYRDRDLTAELVKRAHEARYEAVILTVDTPVLGIRERDVENRFALPEGVVLANLVGVTSASLEEAVDGSALFAFVLQQQDPSVTWDDVAWLRSLTPLPVLVKGVLTAEDARLAVEAGVDGIVVSNHGGRQLDGTIPTALALPEVVEAAADRVEVLVDGGIRRGADVVKALALGARAVLVGRPVLWGLAVGGEEGVGHVLEILRNDLDIALAIAGCPSARDVPPELVGRRPA